MNLITAASGSAHVTPRDHASIYRAITGKASGYFDWGEAFETTVTDNNTVNIASGVGMNQGRMFMVNPGSSDDVTIASGSQRTNRIDIICQKIAVNSVAGTQAGSWHVVKGTPSASTPSAPSVTLGDLDSGDTTALLPMFRVNISGINITSVVIAADKIASVHAVSQKKKLLWENAAPSSSFSGQTLNISGIDNYDKIEIEFATSSYAPRATWPIRLEVGSNSHPIASPAIYTSGYSMYHGIRTAVRATGGVTFGSGSWVYCDGSGLSTDNNYVVPLRIYGLEE